MKNLWACALLAVLWLIAAPSPAVAQSGSGLAGTVRDTSGAVLPGVTVEASSPALIEKVRVVVTDSEGRFSITELNPGRYMVTFSLPGFTTVKREGVDLVTGFTGNVSVELPVGTVEESITVTGASPVVDVQNTRQQVVATRDIIDAVPTGKMYQQLAALIPAVVTEGNDVGGLNGQRVTGVTLHGSRERDTEQQIDGAPVMSWGSISTTTTMLSDGAYQEFVMDVSGASAETETGGLRVNYIPREGGNIFSGGLVVNGSHPRLYSSNLTPELRAQGLGDPMTLKRLWTVNPNIGGPIMKDRVWFFFNYARIVSDLYAAGSYINSCLDCWEYKPDLTRQALDDELGRDVSLRLTWQATTRNKFTAFIEDNYHCKCRYGIGGVGSGFGSTVTNRSESVLRAISDGNIYQVGWTFPATTRMLFQASAATAPLTQARVNQPEVIAPRIEDRGLGVNYRAGSEPSLAFMRVDTYRGAVSYVTGSHAVKVGAIAVMGPTRREIQDFGAVRYRALNGVPTAVTYLRTPFTTLFHVRPNLGLYGQDQWTVKNLTLNLGLRFDYFRNIQPAQTVPASGYVLRDVSVPFLQGVAWKDLNPRLGVSYDLFGNGKTALKATLNRYGLRLGYDEAATASSLNSNASNTRTWTDANGDRIVQGDPLNHTANGELGPSQNLAFGNPVSTVHFDPEHATGWGVRPMNWEVSGGVQQELTSGVALTAVWTRRIYGNFPLFENLAQPASAWDEYCVTAPVDARLPNGGGYQLCGIYDLKPQFVGREDYLGTRANAGYGKQQEHFTAIDVNVSARLQRLLLTSGVSSGKLMTDNCDIVKSAPSSIGRGAGNKGISRGTVNPNSTFCHTESPFVTQFKLSGAYTLPWQEIQVAGVYQDLSGKEILADAEFTRAQVAPSLGRALSQGSTASIPLVAPGTMYGERMHQVDLRVAKAVRLGRTRLQGQLDLYNAFNASDIRQYSGVYGATTGPATGSAFLLPGGILSGRLVKLGMQLTF
jgi:hypothetical protein